ncbi:Shedu anti-phage system protein SduA domain-containing protein [Streptomyces sp. NPDC101151]|uniref:Shedu anti-phage system protein SduA domain-containing protein n=1 Tax=Streptomyces sp. NPDC101151 TaxID=3366115 RepID=UPI0037FA5244
MLYFREPHAQQDVDGENMPMDWDEPTYFDRRPASSGQVSFCDALTLRDNRAVCIKALPYFIPHNSTRSELALKIIREDKRSGEPCEISLKEDELRALKKHIAQCLSVAEQDEDGQFLVLRTDALPAQVDMSDDAARALGGALDNRAFARRVTQHVDPESLARAFSASVRIGELRSAVTELRQNLNEGKTREDVYQNWCECHSWVFGNAYVARDDQRAIGLGDQVDVMMKSAANGLRDIFELKRPDAKVLIFDKTHKNWYWSSDTASAIGQCHRYLDTLHRVGMQGFDPNHPEYVAYHPRAVVVIGRSQGWNDAQLRALHGLNSRMHGISVMTYDQLLAQCEALLSQITRTADEQDASEDIPA